MFLFRLATIAYLPYWTLTWILTSFWKWTIHFWTPAPEKMLTSILVLYNASYLLTFDGD